MSDSEIVLVNPRFETSYWGLEHAMSVFGKRSILPVAALPLLAALTPAEHRVTIVDENVEPLDLERVARADVVGLTGMSVQRERMLEVLRALKSRGAFTVVGGPWTTVREDAFADLADVIFVGEAEETWPRFLEDRRRGTVQRRYEQSERTDMSRVPPPRYDLLRSARYLFGSLQISRGCPFQCEFCDIIVTFGRRPRLKTAEQILVELEALRARFDTVFVVDDNLIGNKKAVKPLLRAIVDWQRERGYPLTFFTEASLDLAEDRELLGLMVEANFQTVFVGIESPNEAALRETKKNQNLRGGLVERVRRIQVAGLEVWCGMILGFDSDDETIFAAHESFLRESRIAHAMVGMLSAIPKTPLYLRLKHEKRLDLEGEHRYGTNVVPLGMERSALRDGYVRLMESLYAPDAYFDRVDSLYLDPEFDVGSARERWWRAHPLRHARSKALDLARAAVVTARLMREVDDPALRRTYRDRIARFARQRPDPSLIFVYAVKCAVHYHTAKLTRGMAERVVNTF
ncbi:MAG: B12-binding domain-containing radical SAM protein [Myxococcota bacterium]|nr:B12-binding domain-containing radical SAM protein [Myxococcota bacterium]